MHKTYEFKDSHHPRSGKRYKVDHKSYFLEYHPSISESAKSNLEESELKPTTPQRTVGSQGNTTSSSFSQTPPRAQKTPMSQWTQLPHRNVMADDIKLPIFRGTRSEDLDQHWFLCEAMWKVKQVTNDDIKMAQLMTMFRDRELNWFMKYTDGQVRTLAQVKVALTAEFKKPKSESQCITKLKEIKQKLTEIVWEFDKKFKTLLDQFSFVIALQ